MSAILSTHSQLNIPKKIIVHRDVITKLDNPMTYGSNDNMFTFKTDYQVIDLKNILFSDVVGPTSFRFNHINGHVDNSSILSNRVISEIKLNHIQIFNYIAGQGTQGILPSNYVRSQLSDAPASYLNTYLIIYRRRYSDPTKYYVLSYVQFSHDFNFNGDNLLNITILFNEDTDFIWARGDRLNHMTPTTDPRFVLDYVNVIVTASTPKIRNVDFNAEEIGMFFTYGIIEQNHPSTITTLDPNDLTKFTKDRLYEDYTINLQYESGGTIFTQPINVITHYSVNLDYILEL